MLPKTLLIGCGRKQVKKISEQCVAMDISEECIEESRKIKPNNIYFNADTMKIPFENSYFLQPISQPFISLHVFLIIYKIYLVILILRI